MTREEAIDWLKAISFCSDHHISEALDMAIEALTINARVTNDCLIVDVPKGWKDEIATILLYDDEKCEEWELKSTFNLGEQK